MILAGWWPELLLQMLAQLGFWIGVSFSFHDRLLLDGYRGSPELSWEGVSVDYNISMGYNFLHINRPPKVSDIWKANKSLKPLVTMGSHMDFAFQIITTVYSIGCTRVLKYNFFRLGFYQFRKVVLVYQGCSAVIRTAVWLTGKTKLVKALLAGETNSFSLFLHH